MSPSESSSSPRRLGLFHLPPASASRSPGACQPWKDPRILHPPPMISSFDGSYYFKFVSPNYFKQLRERIFPMKMWVARPLMACMRDLLVDKCNSGVQIRYAGGNFNASLWMSPTMLLGRTPVRRLLMTSCQRITHLGQPAHRFRQVCS